MLFASMLIEPVPGLLLFLLGAALICVAVWDVYFTVLGFSPFKRLRNNRRGIAWVWITAALALAFMPFVYWAVGWPYDIVVTQITSVYTFTGTMGYALTAVRTVISYLMAFVLLFTVMWSWVNSKSPGVN